MIKEVFAFPPSESDKILVNFESLYGMCFLLSSVNALITIPNYVRL